MNSFSKNRDRLFRELKPNSAVLLHSGEAPHKTTDQFYPFYVSKNFYYLTGIKESNCTLLLLKLEEENRTYLFIDETTEFMRQWVGAKISKQEAHELSEINPQNIMYNETLDNVFLRIMTYGRGYAFPPVENLYLDLYRPSKNHKPLGYNAYHKMIESYPQLSLQDLNGPLSEMRMFKNEYEIADIKKAIKITNEGIKRMMKNVGSRFKENHVEADFNHEIALNGSRRVGFDTIVASGKNATILHYEDNNQRFTDKDMILVDLGAEHDEYSADISRTFPVSGKFSERQKEIYEIVLKTNKETIEFAKPNITWKELGDFARNILIKECKRINLIKDDQEINKYYYHTIGHFLGLDVHDVGHYDQPLQEGMVITIEPGLYIKDEEIGVRIEDNILITKDGCENLSKEIIKEVDDIERFMR